MHCVKFSADMVKEGFVATVLKQLSIGRNVWKAVVGDDGVNWVRHTLYRRCRQEAVQVRYNIDIRYLQPCLSSSCQ